MTSYDAHALRAGHAGACSGNSNSGIILCRFSKDWVDVQEKSKTVLKSACNSDNNIREEISNDGPL